MDSPRRPGGLLRRVRPRGALKPPSGHEHNEHWDGIVADYKPEKKIAMGFVVGVSKDPCHSAARYDLRDEG